MQSILTPFEATRVSAGAQSKAIDVLTLAFASDPICRWCWPGAGEFLNGFPAFTRAFGGRAFATGSAYQVAGCAGAALWLPPDVEPDEARRRRRHSGQRAGWPARVAVFSDGADGQTSSDRPSLVSAADRRRACSSGAGTGKRAHAADSAALRRRRVARISGIDESEKHSILRAPGFPSGRRHSRRNVAYGRADGA